MKIKLVLSCILIGMLISGCKKGDESTDVQPIQINLPVDNAIVHDSVPILFEYDKNLDIIKTEFYIDLILNRTYENVPGKVYFSSSDFQRGTAHVIYLGIKTKDGKTFNSNKVTLIIGKLSKPVVTVDFPDKSSVELHWTDFSNEETGYRILRQEGNSAFTLLSNPGPNMTSYTDHSIDTARRYVYIVEAYSSGENYPSDSIKIEYFLNRYGSFMEYEVPAAIEGKIAISPDGQKIVVTNYMADQFTEINTVTGVQTRLDMAGGSCGLAVSRSGNFFVTGNTHDNNKIRIWDFNTLSMLHEYSPEYYVFELLTNNTDDQILTGGGPVQAYRVADGTLVQTYPEYHTTCRSLKFSKDGTGLLAGGNDSKVVLFSSATGEVIKVYTGHTAQVGTTCFNMDESKIISGSYEENTVLVWDKNTGTVLKTITMNSPTVTIRNGLNDQIIIASGNGEIAVLDNNYNTIQKIRTLNRLLFADYNTADDIIAAYGSVNKQVVMLYKKFGHWERI
jgi:WD40 repeat protein